MKKFMMPLAALTLLMVAGCSQKKEKVNEWESTEFQLSMTAEDSTAIVQLGDECMAALKEGKMDAALDMLCLYDDSLKTVQPLTDETRAAYQRRFAMFPVRDYKLSYFSFREEGLNDLKYDVFFGAAEAGSPKTSFMFNPVKVDGQWHLSVKTAMQDMDETMR